MMMDWKIHCLAIALEKILLHSQIICIITSQKDVALIKLDKELGNETGWMGIAFSNDDSFFKNNVFHKFSYPAMVDAHDSTRVYNGDTLYYNYGIPGTVNNTWLGYDI